jgi:hypothetical protein
LEELLIINKIIITNVRNNYKQLQTITNNYKQLQQSENIINDIIIIIITNNHMINNNKNKLKGMKLNKIEINKEKFL